MSPASHNDKVLLITGGSSGIGAAAARRAVASGFRVALLARHREPLQRLVAELGEARAFAVPCDVRESERLTAAVDHVLQRFGRLDALFANAGIGGSGGGFSDADPRSWRDLLLTNVYGVACSIRACLPALKQSRGHVLITSSAAGRATIAGSMYGASKWAVTAIGYNLREELRGSGMRVTLIEPGFVRTPLLDPAPPQAMEPDAIAEAVLYALAQPPGVDVNEIMVRPTPPS